MGFTSGPNLRLKRWTLRTHPRPQNATSPGELQPRISGPKLATGDRFWKIAREGWRSPLLSGPGGGRPGVPTFSKAAEQCMQSNKASWKNGKHSDQWGDHGHFAPTERRSRAGDLFCAWIRSTTPAVLKESCADWLTQQARDCPRVRQGSGQCSTGQDCGTNRPETIPVQGVLKGLPRDRQSGRPPCRHALCRSAGRLSRSWVLRR
jgi:hypothetical protein